MGNRQKNIIAGIIFGIVIIIIFGIVSLLSERDNSSTDAGLYTDPGSGEIVADNSPLTQNAIENPDTGASTFLGFSFLNENGLSVEQIEYTKNALSEYSASLPERFYEVSLVKSSARYTSNVGSQLKVIVFTIKVNRENDYYVTLTYDDLESVEVKLFESDKETLLFTKK